MSNVRASYFWESCVSLTITAGRASETRVIAPNGTFNYGSE
jgi:hypothetical protein